MQFYRETGAILSPNRYILHLIDGTAINVLFPQETLWSLHQKNPGCIYALAHVHPPNMTVLSHEDETTLFAQALAISPFPARMITIAQAQKAGQYIYSFVETCYFLMLEPKETWIARGKGKRQFEIIKEWAIPREVWVGESEIRETRQLDWYGNVLLQRSYSEPDRP